MEHAASNSATTTPHSLSGLHLDPLLPLTGGMDADQRLLLVARTGLAEYLLGHPTIGFDWLDDLAPVAVSIDLGDVPFVDSVLLGWLLRLGQALPEVPMTLINPNPRLRAQLVLLCLDQVFSID